MQPPGSLHPLFVYHRVQFPEQGQVSTCLVGNRPLIVRKVILFLGCSVRRTMYFITFCADEVRTTLLTRY